MKNIAFVYIRWIWVCVALVFSVTIARSQEVQQYYERAGAGSYGKELAKFPTLLNINGFVTTTFEYGLDEGSIPKFEANNLNLIFGAELTSKLRAEIQMDVVDAENFGILYGLIDYTLSDAFIIRVGKFLIPGSEVNEYQYPQYILKTIERPGVAEFVVPREWTEIGLQIRGKFKSEYSSLVPYYALYVVDGLHGESGASPDQFGRLGQGGLDEDELNNTLGFGGSVGLEVGEYFNFNVHGYKDKYDDDDKLDLMIAGASLSYDDDKFSFYGEYHLSKEDVFDTVDPNLINTIDRVGYFGQVAYKFSNRFEPVVRYQSVDFGETRVNEDGDLVSKNDRVTMGFNYYLKRNAVLKAGYDFDASGSGLDETSTDFEIQLSIGF